MNKILIVAAHPDDDILGCGGLLAKYSDKKDFRVIFIAEGSSCRFPDYEEGDFSKTIMERNEYSLVALDSLGVNDVKFYNLPCGRLDTVPIIKINKIIESEIKNFKADTVITHSEHDANNDHRIVNRSIKMATRPGVFDYLNRVMSFEVQSSSEWNFNDAFLPNFFEKLTEEDVLRKWKALSCFKSETREYPHPRSFEGMNALARYRGIQVGCDFAEAYKISWILKA